jgi:DUF4097 and DUF4098 domain-containing protein YvlB
MKKDYFARISLGCFLCMLILLPGCFCINIGCWSQAEFERTVQVSAPLVAGSMLVAETGRGSITITGADVADCNVTAEICARAPTEQEAQQIANQVKIHLEPAGKTLTVKMEKPRVTNNRSISVSFNIIVPNQTDIKCASSRGPTELIDIRGKVKGETSRGSLTAENIHGSLQLDTSRGSINCRDISSDNIRLDTSRGNITLFKASCDSLKLESSRGNINVSESAAGTANLSSSRGHITYQNVTTSDLTANSSRGNVNIDYSPSAPGEITADITTSRGDIYFLAPPSFSGQVELTASRGSIKTDLPITVQGQINEERIKGTIGEGKGGLRLKTSRGSIKIR